MIKYLNEIPTSEQPGVVYHYLGETKKLASAHVSVQVGGKVPNHIHHDEEQTYYVLSGRGEIELGGEVHPLERDTYVYIPLHTEHEVRNLGDEPLNYVYFVAFVPPHD